MQPSRVAAFGSVCALWWALLGCVRYTPEPIEPLAVLDELRTVTFVEAAGAERIERERAKAGPGARELAAFAVNHHPALAAVRAAVGLRSALLVEAGLLPNVEMGWGAMDLVASQLVNGSSSPVDVISGFEVLVPLLPPGQRDARISAAESRLEAARWRVLAAEWQLTRDIYVACEERRVAETQVEQRRTLAQLAESVYDYFLRARQAGTATAIQANLALGEWQAIRLELIRAETRELLARQGLNALLGLPPEAEVPLAGEDQPASSFEFGQTVEEWVTAATDLRPDLQALLADYQAREDDLRQAVAEQFPTLYLGTGIRFGLPLLSDFGRPQIRTALARREQARREFTARVHAVRQEIHRSHARWRYAQREVEWIEKEWLPNAEENLRLSREAFKAGEVTLLETLALQRALVQARTEQAEARASAAKRRWQLLAAGGGLLIREGAVDPARTEEDE